MLLSEITEDCLDDFLEPISIYTTATPWEVVVGVAPVATKIIYNGPCTIVFWVDGTKTVVKCAKDQQFTEYGGFVAAVAKKLFGSTSKVQKIIKDIKEE